MQSDYESPPITQMLFLAHEVKLLKKAIYKRSTHIPKQAPPFSPLQLKVIVEFLTALSPPPFVLIVIYVLYFLKTK